MNNSHPPNIKNKSLQFQFSNAGKSFSDISDIKPLEFSTALKINTSVGFGKKNKKNSSGGSKSDNIIESSRNIGDTETKIEKPKKVRNPKIDKKIGN